MKNVSVLPLLPFLIFLLTSVASANPISFPLVGLIGQKSASSVLTSAGCVSSGGAYSSTLVATGACDWLFTTPGSNNWTVPSGVSSVSAVCVGGGGGGGNGDGSGGGGGALAYKNNISVSAGAVLVVQVGAGGSNAVSGGASSFAGVATAGGGSGLQTYAGNAGGTFANADGGGNGGAANTTSGSGGFGGGGGAGGYAGAGGYGGNNGNGGGAGVGGAGGGGGGYNTAGGGVGLNGQGGNGVASTGYSSTAKGGSSGQDALGTGALDSTSATGGLYGGGGGATAGGRGAQGACRIIWGAGRAFPSTLTTSTDPCYNSPTPGTVCTGGSIYLGSLSPGSTSGSGTDRYMTTPGGCTDIPSPSGGSGTTSWSSVDFTPASCSGTDSLTKTWEDASSTYYDIPSMGNYTTTESTGQGATNTDAKYGFDNTNIIAAITSAGQGGYHAAARYCDKLSYGGYTDWHLPSRYELNLMFTNKASVPGLSLSASDFYWGSTEYDGTNAWFQRFSDGYQGKTVKNNAYRFRCVRRY